MFACAVQILSSFGPGGLEIAYERLHARNRRLRNRAISHMAHPYELPQRKKVCISSGGFLRLSLVWLAFLGWHYRYLSNTASFVFYDIACLIRPIEFAALFADVEDNLR